IPSTGRSEGRADGKRATIGEHQLPRRTGILRSVARVVALDRHFVARVHEPGLYPAPQDRRRRAGFEGPLLHLAGGVFDVEEKPGVRVLQSHFSHDAFHGHRLACIENCRKRVMGGRHATRKQESARTHENDTHAVHIHLISAFEARDSAANYIVARPFREQLRVHLLTFLDTCLPTATIKRLSESTMTRTIRMLVSVASVLAVFSYRPGSDMRALASPAVADCKAVPDWLQLPQGRDQLGNMHGDVAVSSTGDVYVSVQDPQAGLQVYAPDGRFLRSVPDAPADLHGFVIRRQPDGEFIFGPTLRGQTIVKMTLDGKVVLAIPASAIPDEFKVRNARSGQLGVLLTGMDVAPNGDLYVTEGYASDYIHRFDKAGKYLTSFGGKKEPYNFNTLHKLAIDTRF